MVLAVRLDDHDSRPLSPPRPARDLGQKLERALGRAEIRKAENAVGREDADDGDAWKVVPLRHHLRPDEEIALARLERRQDPLRRAAPARGVAVEPADPGAR